MKTFEEAFQQQFDLDEDGKALLYANLESTRNKRLGYEPYRDMLAKRAGEILMEIRKGQEVCQNLKDVPREEAVLLVVNVMSVLHIVFECGILVGTEMNRLPPLVVER